MPEQLGKRLKQLREAYDLSGTFVADEIDINANTFWNIERGRSDVRMTTAIKLSRFYNISLDLLVFGTDDEFNEHLEQISESDMADAIESMERYGYGRAGTRWHSKAN